MRWGANGASSHEPGFCGLARWELAELEAAIGLGDELSKPCVVGGSIRPEQL